MYRFSLILIEKSLNMVWVFWKHYVCKFWASKNWLPISCKGQKVVKIHRTFKINNYRFWNIFIKTMPKIILAMLNCYVFKFWSLQTKEQKTWYFCSRAFFSFFFPNGWKLVNVLSNDSSMRAILMPTLRRIFDNITKVKSSAFWLNFEDQYVSIFIDFNRKIAKYGLSVLETLCM